MFLVFTLERFPVNLTHMTIKVDYKIVFFLASNFGAYVSEKFQVYKRLKLTLELVKKEIEITKIQVLVSSIYASISLFSGFLFEI